MNVQIIREAGYMEALYGIARSFGITSQMSFGDFRNGSKEEHLEVRHRMDSRATMLAGKGAGHDKFLRQVCLWVLIDPPLYWWKQFDQYKVATVTQSESAMHTLMKRHLTREDFEGPINWKFMEFLNERLTPPAPLLMKTPGV